MNSLRQSFKDFDNGLYLELNEMKAVFNQMEAEVEQRVISSTSASGSQSKSNTRKNKITPAASSNKKNKTVEVHPRKVMSSSNKKNHVSMCNANSKHPIKDANSKFVRSTCNGCLFFANHDKCVVAYINDVNEHVKSKSGHPNHPLLGNVTISRVYCVEGLGHNLFSVSQLCDSDLEVAFHKHTCFVRNLEVGIARSCSRLPKLKYEKDHLCSVYSLGKSRKPSHKPKAKDNIQEKLYLLHMDLCEPMRVESINRKKYILVIVDDYSRLYNLFDKFASVQGETLYEYYWRFSQLINDIKFVTNVKLAKSLYTTNYDQLYAYLSQHERHGNEVRIMRERNPDPLALVAYSQTLYNLSQSPQHLVTQHSQAEFPQLDSSLVVPTFQQGEDSIYCINKAMAFLSVVASRQTQSFTSTGNKGIATTSRGNYAAGQAKVVKCDDYLGERDLEKQYTQPKRPRTFQTEDLDAYDSDCDDIFSAKAVLMANLSRCDSGVLSEESQNAGIQDTNSSAPNDLLVLSLFEQMTNHVANLDKENQTNKMVNESLTVELERYKERVAIFEQRLNVDLNKHEKLIDSQMDDLIRNRNAKFAAFQQEIDTLKETLSNQVKEKEYLSTTLTAFKIECKEKESKYMDKEIVLKTKIKKWKILFLKPSNYNPDTSVKSHKPVRIEAPSELPKVSLVNESLKKIKYQLASFDKVMKKRTTSDAITTDEITEVQIVFNQMEAVVDQCFVDKNAFEIQIIQLSIDNDQLLKQIMSQEIVHIVVNYVDILNVNKSCVDECNKCLELETELLKKKDLTEKDVYDKLLKSYLTFENHCISLELTTQLNQEIFQKDNFCENQNVPTFNQLFEINELKAHAQEKDTVIRKLKDRIKSLSRKDSVQNVKKYIDEIEIINIELEHNTCSIQLDIKPISHRLKNNRDAHEVDLEKTIENTDTLRGLVECARKHNPSESILEYACMFTKHVQELLVYVSKTFPSLTKPCEKLVSVTPMNKDKKVRFAVPVTSSSNIPKQTDSLRTKDSNKPLLTSTRVNTTTSASGSKPSSNTKENRISQPPSSIQKNKVEEHPRKVKSSLNKTNSVSEPISNAHVKHSVRNTKFESICAICNKCLVDANHDILKNNRDAHEVYLEKTIENTDTLHGIVECARKQNPSEPLLESSCMFTKHVQELLIYVSKTCPSLTKPAEKLVAVTPMNKDKKVRFAEPVTSSSDIPKQTNSLRTKDYNKPLLTSTGVNTTTSASGLKPLGNTKKKKDLATTK
ncbi:hypothetical protein Tco_0990719 [Tanacetum coccineum]|uniref:Integrase, catalytic region, zinc finger, CCHC-type, peptidase aspartic, catalytic n=1 Tax=Tanacetum coccineum TaxID=301880 RepID=A0ABQ5EYD8_9ASTR